MTNFIDYDNFDENRLSRFTGEDWLAPARVKVEGEYLLWTYRLEKSESIVDGKPVKAVESRDLIGDFIRLASLADRDERLFKNAVNRFASSYGVLGICEHGLPATHHKEYNLGYDLPPTYCSLPAQDGWNKEPLERWRHYSRLVRGILNLSNNINQGKIGIHADWKILIESDLIPNRKIPTKLVNAQVYMTFTINWLLQITDVRPFFQWIEKSRNFNIGSWATGHNLLSVIAVQLMLLINNSTVISICSSCGDPFLLNNRQRAHNNVYCKRCRKKGAWRKASQNYRQRRKTNPYKLERYITKLSKKQAKSIRKEYARLVKKGVPKMECYIDLAFEYETSDRNIRKIIRRETWKNI